MKKKEQWIPWKSITGLYYMSLNIVNEKELIIELTQSSSNQTLPSEREKILIRFKNSFYAYRSTDESFRVRTMNEHWEHPMLDASIFFKVVNSDYMQWFSQESCEMNDIPELTHFAFTTINSIEDVIACEEPIIELITITKNYI